MINKEQIKKIHGILRLCILISLVLCMGCGGGGGDSSTPEPQDSSLAYDSTYTAVTGNLKIKMADMVNNSHVQETVVLQDFSLALGDCSIEEYTITPELLTFTEDTPQTLTVNVTTASSCFADTLTLTATKVISRVQSGVSLSPESSTIALGYNVPVEAGAEDHAGAYGIQFVSADPLIMALSGMGGYEISENSLVAFMVKDKNGDPLAGETVNFALTTTIGGLTLTTTSDISDADGLVMVNVLAGNVPTSVAVIATLEDLSASTQSSLLSVNTGLPDQNSFSLSVDTFNPEGWEYDGETVTFTIRAADHLNNPVPDGTAVYFSTEGGAIEPSCTTVNGACSVVWTSQAPRPSDGRVTIIATAIGSETFIDANGNGFYDHGELFGDLDEAFRDDNEDGEFDYGYEEFFDFNENGMFDYKNGVYNGFLCSDVPYCTAVQVHVRTDTVIAMSGSTATINISPSSVDLTTTLLQNVEIIVSDVNGNTMPDGSSVTIETTNGALVGDSSFTVEHSNSSLDNPDDNMVFTISLEPDENDDHTGSLTVTVTTPKGKVSTRSISVID